MATAELTDADVFGAPVQTSPQPQPQTAAPGPNWGPDDYSAAGYQPIHAPDTGKVVGWLPPVGPQAQSGALTPPAAPPAPIPQAPLPQAQDNGQGAPSAPAATAPKEMSDADVFAPDNRPTSEGLGFIEGLTKPLDNAAAWANKVVNLDGVARTLGLPTTDEANDARSAGFAAAEQTQRPGAIGKIGGEVLGTLPLAMAPGGAATGIASKLPAIGSVAARLAPAAGTLLQGAGAGALLTDSPNNAGQVAKDAATGGIGGLAGGAVLGAIGKAAAPVLKPTVQKLIDAGVRLTPGQATGGAVQTIEDALTSVPVLKDAINAAKRRGMEDFNRAAWNDSLGEIGEKLPGAMNVGRDAVNHVSDRFDAAYDAIKPQIRADVDVPLVHGVGGVRTKLASVAPDHVGMFDEAFKDSILNRMGPNGELDGQAFKDADTELGQAIAKASPSPTPKDQRYVDALKGLQDELRASVGRNSPPDVAQRFSDIQKGYAKWTRLRAAAADLGAKDGLFTPSILNRSARAGDNSVGKGTFAKGNALMQGLAEAGKDVLPSTVPDSGTALRYMVSEFPMLLGFGAESQHFLPHVAGAFLGLGTAGLPYSRVGQRLTQKLLTTRPWTPAQSKAVVSALRPYLVDAGAVGGQKAGAKALPQLPAR